LAIVAEVTEKNEGDIKSKLQRAVWNLWKRELTIVERIGDDTGGETSGE
jgi:hypothetical protein